MARFIRPKTGVDFTKKGWRRRILIRVITLLTILCVAIGGFGLWMTRALPGIAASEISRLTNTRIEMGTFDFHPNASVSIAGMIIRPEREDLFYDDTIMRAKSVYAKFSLGSLLLLSPRVTEIRIEDFVLDVQCDLDTGRWNIGGLRLNASSGKKRKVPVITLQQGRLRFSKVSGGESEVVTSVPIEARFGFPGPSDGSYGFEIRTAKLSGGYGDSELRGSWSRGRFEIAGGLSSTDIPSLERAWAVDVLAADLTYDTSGAYELTMQIQDLHSKHSPEVDAFRLTATNGAQLSGPLAAAQRFFARYRPFGKVASIRLQARGRFDAISESKVTGNLVCEDISIRDSRFPYAINHLKGNVAFSESGVSLEHLQGQHGDVNVIIQGWTRGFGDGRTYQYQILSDNMVLDDDLYAALKPDQKRLWDAFEPDGVIGVDYRLARSNPTNKRSYVAIDLQGVTATYQKFPYPLIDMRGGLYFDRNSIMVTDVIADGDGRHIKLNGEVTGRGTDRPLYHIVVDANGIPFDATLRQALPEQYRALAKRVDASGTVGVHATVFTSEDPNSANPISFMADASLANASLKMDSWPITLTDMSADVSITPTSAAIKDCVGHYRQSEIRVAGGMQFAQDDQPGQYHLNVTTKQTPLDATVLGLLPESMREHVQAFRPEGAVDVAIDYRQIDSNAPADYVITVACQGDKINHERFPYPLENVRGTVRLDPTAVVFEGIEAVPSLQSDPSLTPSVRVDGRLSLQTASRGEGNFTVKAHDILFTQQLGESLPKSLRGIYRDSSPRGPFDLDVNTLEVTGTDHKLVRFAGRMDLNTCSLDVSGAGTEVCGKLDVAAAYDTRTGFSTGQMHLAADRLNVKGKDITNLDAELVYDPNTRVWSAHNFLGHCYRGKLLGNLRIEPVEQGIVQYLATVGLVRVDLQRFLFGRKLNREDEADYSSGTMNATLGLGARVGDGSSRLGVCRIDVANMQVGKVSPLANLLAVLSLTEPTDYAFERMLIESYFRRNKLLISKFDMAGKNLAFTGAGTMNLRDGDVDLALTARGRRVAAAKPSILQSLTEGLGGAVVRMEVTGKVDSPKVETKALPVIEDSLKVLGMPQ